MSGFYLIPDAFFSFESCNLSWTILVLVFSFSWYLGVFVYTRTCDVLWSFGDPFRFSWGWFSPLYLLWGYFSWCFSRVWYQYNSTLIGRDHQNACSWGMSQQYGHWKVLSIDRNGFWCEESTQHNTTQNTLEIEFGWNKVAVGNRALSCTGEWAARKYTMEWNHPGLEHNLGHVGEKVPCEKQWCSGVKMTNSSGY